MPSEKKSCFFADMERNQWELYVLEMGYGSGVNGLDAWGDEWTSRGILM